jgi:hypothetical protein
MAEGKAISLPVVREISHSGRRKREEEEEEKEER